jgi:serine/threonine-protein kinase
MHDHIASNPAFRQRFQREMKLMSQFQHPNAVVFHNASLDDPQGPCIVMEYLQGVTLDRLLARNVRFNPMRLHRFVSQLCSVLGAAHELGIVHRDLKPGNLMVLDPDSPQERIKVMDFGLAQNVRPHGQLAPGETIRPKEFAVGTPGYMAPEQVRGEEVDQRSDLYSVGAILFQMLTGKKPFTGKTVMEVLMAQATDGPPSFASLGVADQVPAEVEEVVRWALAYQPDDRPQNAQELFDAYEAAVKGTRRPGQVEPVPVQTPPDPTSPAAAETLKSSPEATVDHLEAYMPEKLAVYKLQGFVEEVEGKITRNLPGLLQLQLKVNRNAIGSAGGGLLSWLGLGPRFALVDVELRMKKKTDAANRDVLDITVLLRPAGGGPVPDNPDWHARCNIVTSALRAYLMSS